MGLENGRLRKAEGERITNLKDLNQDYHRGRGVALFIHRGRADLRAGNEREGGHSPTATGTGSAADEL